MKGIITFGYGEGSKRVLALLSGTGMGSCLTLNQPSLGSDTTFSGSPFQSGLVMEKIISSSLLETVLWNVLLW